MVDIVGYFPATAAVDGATGARLRYAEAKVYAWSDTTYATPLAITDLQGIPMPGGQLVAADGVYPDFIPPAGVLQVRVKSGIYVTPMTSLTVFAQAADQSATRAADAALAAAEDRNAAERAAEEAAAAAASVSLGYLDNEDGTLTLTAGSVVDAGDGTLIIGA